jgi:hypothetical protein
MTAMHIEFWFIRSEIMNDERMKAAQFFSESAPKSICRCGHTGDGANSEHAGLIARGHGRCLAPGCDCEKFSWAGPTEQFKQFMAQLGTQAH